jgi:hypothetical protein
VVGDRGRDPARHVVGHDGIGLAVQLALDDDAPAFEGEAEPNEGTVATRVDDRGEELVDPETEILQVIDAQARFGTQRRRDEAGGRQVAGRGRDLEANGLVDGGL